jgi:hypothetical protein
LDPAAQGEGGVKKNPSGSQKEWHVLGLLWISEDFHNKPNMRLALYWL